MGEYIIEPFKERLPTYGKMERFNEQFFRVIDRAMELVDGTEMDRVSAWTLAFFHGLRENDPLMTDIRLICGIALALLDSGLIDGVLLNRIIHTHPSVSEAYFRRWVSIHIRSCEDSRKNRLIAAATQGDDEKEGSGRRRSHNGLMRIRSI